MNQRCENEAMEIANVRLRLRHGLQFQLHEYGGVPCYVAQDSTSSGFYQLGLPEYAFVSLLDGETTIQEAVEEISSQLDCKAFTIRDATRTCHWLLQNRLADPVDASQTARANVAHLLDGLQERGNAKLLAQSNPLFIKLPLGNPEPIIRWASDWFGWTAGKLFFMVWLCTLVIAVFHVWSSSAELTSAALSIFVPSAWMWLSVTFVCMKILHELGHGLFCKQFGGHVPEAGLVFILFVPIPYVDVTSCWGFASKWKRIAVSAAGMYAELFVASIAAILWAYNDDPVTRFHLFNVMLTGSLTTILFNANFLMRFDGYYILSDLIEIPNLAQSGQQFLQHLGRRYLLGMHSNPVQESLARGLAIKSYGLAAFVWRIFICISLSIMATALFYGFGIALAIVGVAIWVGLPAWRLLGLLMGRNGSERPPLGRIAFVAAPVAVAVILSLFIIPWPFQVSAPAIVQYQDADIVRPKVSGFVSTVLASSGSHVREGEVLLELNNPELTAELAQLEAAKEMSMIRSRRFHSDRDIPAYQAEVVAWHSLERQVEDIRQQQSWLQVTASRDGTVIGTDLDSLSNRYVERGAPLFKIVDESQKEIVLAIDQNDLKAFSQTAASNATFRTDTCTQVSGNIVSVAPLASTNVDPRLTSCTGGPLAVRPASRGDSETDTAELLHPRFKAVVELADDTTRGLRTGSIGRVSVGQYPGSIAGHVITELRSWIVRALSEVNSSQIL